MKMINIKVQDQFNHIHEVQALLRQIPEHASVQNQDIFQRIEHIVVDNEVILPSIELLFESQHSCNIYRILD